jgi:hypothetical protein
MKGYFIHKQHLYDANPTNFDFCWVKTRQGMDSYPNLDRCWDVSVGVPRGIYQFAGIMTAEENPWHHSSVMVQDLQNYPADWVVLFGDYMNLIELQTWVGNFLDQAPPIDHKPVIFMTHDHWNKILKGDDVQVVAERLIAKADICISQYNVEHPTMPRYCQKLFYWESEDGIVQYEPNGIQTVDQQPDDPGDPDPGDPDVPSNPGNGYDVKFMGITILSVEPKKM